MTAVPSVFSPPISKVPGVARIWTGLRGCSDALALAHAIKADQSLYLVVTPDTQTAVRLEQEIRYFLEDQTDVLHFPDWETLPYDMFSPLSEIVSERLKCLVDLAGVKRGVLIAPVATLMQRLSSREHVLGSTFSLKPGDRLDLEGMRRRLESVSYLCVQQVMQHGEFAVRGSILDLFPMGSEHPFRVELFDEEIESIRTFDPETQRSSEKVSGISLFPAREFPFDDAAIRRFRQKFRDLFPESAQGKILYQEVSKGVAPGGIDYYLPLFVDSTELLLDYLPSTTRIVLHGEVEAAARRFYEDTETRYQARSSSLDRPPLAPELLFLPPDRLSERFNRHPQILLATDEESESLSGERIHFAVRTLPEMTVRSNRHDLGHAELTSFVGEQAGRSLFVAETRGHREELLRVLAQMGLRPTVFESFSSFVRGSERLGLVVAPIDQGGWISVPDLAIIAEAQLSGERVQQRRRRKASTSPRIDQILRNLEELAVGDPVVHQDHGVGRFMGLTKLVVGGIESEFLTLAYAGEDTLYVPVSSLHLIGRYSGADPEHAPLHRLGGEQWQRARRKALERVRDVAAELLDIYAKREAQTGFSFEVDTPDYQRFSDAFPFEETPDQLLAIEAVMKDMAQARPMDRVVCGDVGFGKTEVAMRAAFLAVQSNRQVAVLVPTTLLAQQHFQNFRDRFADWPIRIEVLSRFISKKRQDEVLAEAAEGKVDILIGTHKLFQKDLRFRQLGLVIVDEEQRFGVSQKEHFKKLRSEIDILTLTATPIPRTLNLAMSGLRDISIIATPPPNRHAIKTFVTEWDDALIEEALHREIKRGGQAYFLHNKIETMEKMERELSAKVPLANIRIAHGQMPERELEAIMLDFYHQRFNVLICTTIIESGIDVPSANTIIIHRADQLGLSQLHQIRGRVGRSHHRAYAYLIVPPKSLMTSDAVKRLEAITATGELGAGFMLASHDLEIRGAGELLGDEQSGQIQEVGLSLYTELLERAVKAMRLGLETGSDLLPQDSGPEIDLQCPALIPETYLPDVHARLVLYKRMANARDLEELRALQVEMIDRFGLFPPPLKVLLAMTELKIHALSLGIRRIEAGAQGGRLIFSDSPAVDPLSVINLIQGQPSIYRLEGPQKLRFIAPLPDPLARVDFIDKLLTNLMP
mgnify:CR=1 FL=1